MKSSFKIHATTVNRSDCGLRASHPWFTRFFGAGLLHPKVRILGSELAGEVEPIGLAVSQFAVGDHVFGIKAGARGAHAEFSCMQESATLAHNPATMTFEEVAAVCEGMMDALMWLRAADLRRGQRVLIYGAPARSARPVSSWPSSPSVLTEEGAESPAD
jgi:NADPH:quinone reductase-like Zn-dependent oxidoreductase